MHEPIDLVRGRSPWSSLILILIPIVIGPVCSSIGPAAASPPVVFEDDFGLPDGAAVGGAWREWTKRYRFTPPDKVTDFHMAPGETPWRIRGGALSFRFRNDAPATAVQDFVVTADPIRADDVRIEFELRGSAATTKGYVGPRIYLLPDVGNLKTADNYESSNGQSLVGVCARYRWENKGTRGMMVFANGESKDFPDQSFAGLNGSSFAKHTITIRDGSITYASSATSTPIVIPLARPLEPGAKRYLLIGSGLWDQHVAQSVEIRNLAVTALDSSSNDDAASKEPSTPKGDPYSNNTTTTNDRPRSNDGPRSKDRPKSTDEPPSNPSRDGRLFRFEVSGGDDTPPGTADVPSEQTELVKTGNGTEIRVKKALPDRDRNERYENGTLHIGELAQDTCIPIPNWGGGLRKTLKKGTKVSFYPNGGLEYGHMLSWAGYKATRGDSVIYDFKIAPDSEIGIAENGRLRMATLAEDTRLPVAENDFRVFKGGGRVRFNDFVRGSKEPKEQGYVCQGFTTEEIRGNGLSQKGPCPAGSDVTFEAKADGRARVLFWQ